MTIKYGSVCSGIEAASIAWYPLGWRAAWLAEIEPFPASVLAHRHPDVPNLGDMTTIARRVLAGEIEAPDVLVGGTPCQAFSVAGMRKGMTDPRGQLTIKFVELANAIDSVRESPAIIVWENVPGVLSDKGNAFGCFLGALAGESCELQPAGGKWSNAGCVYGPERAIAWRVLDAQYFGVAQRRRRVFLVASARNDFDPAAILFERDGLRRDTAPRREAWKDAPAHVGKGASGYRMTAFGEYADDETACTMKARDYKDATDLAVMSIRGTQEPDCNTELAHTPGRNQGQAAVAYGIPGNWIGRAPENGGNAVEPMLNIAPCQTRTDRHGVAQGLAVRRLTPRECERLQGFPDDYTAIPWRNKPAEECPDGPRYKALGNSMAVPCMRWVGERIEECT